VRALPDYEPNAAWRNWRLAESHADPFVRALGIAIPNYLPATLLEGHADATRIALSHGFPRKPKVIVTANAFSADDRWILWAGEQMEAGAKLVITQHGGHYGTGAWNSSQDHEIAIADRFLSWGWTSQTDDKVLPAPATKLIGVKKRAARSSGICLQVTATLPRQSYWLYSVPTAGQYLSYLNDQFRFVSALNPAVQGELLVRLHPRDFGWDTRERWAAAHPAIATDSGETAIQTLVEDTRLYVATYNATTFLESFRQGVPTVMFWDPRYWELNSYAAPYFDVLRRAGILYDDPETCARHVNGIWDNVPEWWESPEVQGAVTDFSDRFAYVGDRPLRELKAAITDWPVR
jgi:putative transferase (TIGR04331 family)